MSLRTPQPLRFRRTLRLETLEDRLAPAAPVYSIGAGAGAQPRVKVVLDDGSIRQFYAYDAAFRGGVHVATADMTGDGVNDIITAPGTGGGPHIRVIDGVTGFSVREFLAYAPEFRGGVFVAAGDVNRDGRADIITGAGPGGGPHVKAFSVATFEPPLFEYMAYDPNFRGGVTVGAGDMNADSFAEVITGAGVGGGPHVRVFDPNARRFIADFFAFDPATRFGVNVASMPTGVFGSNSIIASLGLGGPPEVRVFNFRFERAFSFMAADPNFLGGINVGSVTFNFGGSTVLTGAGPNGQTRVNRFFAGIPSPILQSSFLAFEPQLPGGVFVG